MEQYQIAHEQIEKFNEQVLNAKLSTSFEMIQEGNLVYVVHDAGDRWTPVVGIYEYTASYGNLGITYISGFDRNPAAPRTILCVPNKDVFLTEKECRDYINSYWYHGKCETCKYDQYSSNQNCYNCKNKVKLENKDKTKDATYYCKNIFDGTGLKYVVASYYSKGYPICNQFDPIINNGDWINFHWYMEVMKNCWCNADKESACSAKRTVCRGASFKRELHKSNNISIRFSYQEHEYIVRSYIPYYQWLKQTFIQGDKIFVDIISIEISKNTKTVKYNDVEVKEFLNLAEIENVVKENL